ncbi:hypothetical protein D8X55_04370 [Malacoplasma penetrans]|uniref:class III lanthionine synthetase LanKC N-terminal domain-containing protein n=1 Tax=Malacoplasma penetrans TaxID=28227 RepID=UPI001011BFE8|nr:hypothetical protein [Malacoplasma penetrans]RXY96234.1 hypothetical protein D8X55_04370 [Malacoplasma penetrans]
MDKIQIIFNKYKLIYKDLSFYTKNKFTYVNYKLIDSLPNQGWKIHVSSTLDNYQQILDICINYCLNKNILFKFICNDANFIQTLQKHHNRKSTGKFITIYCKDEIELIDNTKALYDKLKDFKGPSVLTDKSFKNSCIHYRYGGFKSDYIYNERNEKILDKREIGKHCPNFIKDPLTEKQNNNDDSFSSHFLLHNKYDIFKAIYFSNHGGIYLAYDLYNNNRVVLIKEFRPYLGINSFWNSTKLGLNEIEQLKYFTESNTTPKIIESFTEENHLFVVREHIDGLTLKDFFYENSLLYFEPTDKNVLKVIKNLVLIIIDILKFYDFCISSNKLVLDIKLSNFLFDCKNKKTYFIDLESIHDNNETFNKNIYFINNRWLSLNNKLRSKNVLQKKLSILMIELICKSNNFLYLAKSINKTFERFYIFANNYKLPLILVELINKMYYSKKTIDPLEFISNLKNIDWDNYEVFVNKNNDIKLYLQFNKETLEEIKNNILIKSNTLNSLLLNLKELDIKYLEKNWDNLSWYEKYFLSTSYHEVFKVFVYDNYNKKRFFNLRNKNEVEQIFNKIFLNLYLSKNVNKNIQFLKKAKQDIKYIIENKLVKNKSYFYIKNEMYSSPNILNGTCGLIFLMNLYYQQSQDDYMKNKIILLLPTIKSSNLLKVSFEEGLAGFVYTLIHLTKTFKSWDLKNDIKEMTNIILFSKVSINRKIKFIDMYKSLKNDLCGTLGIYLYLKEFIEYNKNN